MSLIFWLFLLKNMDVYAWPRDWKVVEIYDWWCWCLVNLLAWLTVLIILLSGLNKLSLSFYIGGWLPLFFPKFIISWFFVLSCSSFRNLVILRCSNASVFKKEGVAMQFSSLFRTCSLIFGRFMLLVLLLSKMSSSRRICEFVLLTLALLDSAFIPSVPFLLFVFITKFSKSITFLQ